MKIDVSWHKEGRELGRAFLEQGHLLSTSAQFSLRAFQVVDSKTHRLVFRNSPTIYLGDRGWVVYTSLEIRQLNQTIFRGGLVIAWTNQRPILVDSMTLPGQLLPICKAIDHISNIQVYFKPD